MVKVRVPASVGREITVRAAGADPITLAVSRGTVEAPTAEVASALLATVEGAELVGADTVEAAEAADSKES